MNIIGEIRSLMNLQAASIQSVARTIGPEFQKAVRIIFSCRGKLIVTGVGKSGVIAQKISSTFASTGTPSIYLHPSEALHGNLGVVQKKDVVLAIGKSGESEELIDLIPSFRKIGVKIIALTANDKSTLARQSDVILHTPVSKEACPLNLAPTTSSTVALVVGDALAIVLMKQRGFNSNHFAIFHPGGLLGKKLLLKVSDVMRSGNRNPVVPIGASMERLLEEISDKWAGASSVVGKGKKFLGIVTDYDVRKALLAGKPVLNLSIQDVMNKNPITIRPDEMAIKAAEIMEFRKKPLTVLPVVDQKKRAVGMIHTHDLINLGFIEKPSDTN
jgi:arabinose-5-phosphate isomerase